MDIDKLNVVQSQPTPASPAAFMTSATLMPAKTAPTKRLMITKMQLENFKSYAGNVEIGSFHKYISAVVGPNGSGKSNVIDALLFVFGKRASNLRLKKVSNLVHRSADFSDLDMATVSVFFHEIIDTEEGEASSEIIDNEANYVVVPNSEFCVTRTATKSNVSKYFINDKPREVKQIAMMKSKGAEGTNEDGIFEYLEDIIGSNIRRIEYGTEWNSAMTLEEKKLIMSSVFVRNLPFGVTQEELEHVFSGIGPVKKIDVIK
ncbi:hypothetical protein PsorP6_000570 [Peronosclerospora sorghi]|uniref:Uncharacterized protein n=1 Tax=Peronosclerospora sorghi TaxID=230839 RepID=A0ACC0WSB3_9STRA|nr:hypothetical protein PsorP6_000570 [Peronosclerospora sorghi]